MPLPWLSVYHRMDFSCRHLSSVAFCWAVSTRGVSDPLWRDQKFWSCTLTVRHFNRKWFINFCTHFILHDVPWIDLIVRCGWGKGLFSLHGNPYQIHSTGKLLRQINKQMSPFSVSSAAHTFYWHFLGFFHVLPNIWVFRDPLKFSICHDILLFSSTHMQLML